MSNMALIVFKFIAIVLVSYFCGTFTFARYVSKARNKDVLAQGSGNPGTMNMVRNYGYFAGAITLVLDAVKCVLPCLGAYFLMQPAEHPQLANIAIVVAGLACVLGHIYPITYQFKGGKGVASSFGFAFIANWWLTLACFGVFVIVFVVSHIAAISTLSACIVFVVVNSILLFSKGYVVSAILHFVLLAVVLFAHRGNIKRIVTNKEKKIDLKETAQKDRDYFKSVSKRKKQTEVDVDPPEIKEVGDK